MTRVLLTTAATVGDLDEDQPLLLAALAARGVEAEVAVWDDPAVDWSAADLVVIRSTWDYASRRDAFVAWAEAVAEVTRLANPAAVVRWNTDKRYLRQLAEAGVPVVPTTWFEPGDEVVVPAGELVVKPTVSAGARDTTRHGPGGGAEVAVRRLLGAGRGAMVQPYLAAVESAGETGLVFVGGAYSHAFRKGALLRSGAGLVRGLYAEEDIGPRTAAAAERAMAEAVLAAVPAELGQLLYARVDVVPGPGGEPVLLELELTEPSLFLTTDDGAADRLADAVVAVL